MTLRTHSRKAGQPVIALVAPVSGGARLADATVLDEGEPPEPRLSVPHEIENAGSLFRVTDPGN
jgi:hypothetical protein